MPDRTCTTRVGRVSPPLATMPRSSGFGVTWAGLGL
jgi:hypothetical protein